ncbi:MAG: serine/threonine protein kinase [Deltaproteobacteria bacterium]|nr:serine/threonine protein kinase [Deltaproteobacteria bacterium]
MDGEYELVALLGSGSHADVFSARKRSGEPGLVAVKILSPLYLSLPEGDFRKASAGLRREGELLSSLTSACFVRIVGAGETPDRRPYIAMDLAEGPTLGAWLQSGERPLRQVAEVIRQWAHGLGELHRLGWVHRDVSPANSVVVARGPHGSQLRSYDLGTASQISDRADRFRVGFDRDRPAGTPAYMSPEQATGGVVTGRADQFSLAAIAYEALAGRRAIAIESARAAQVLAFLRGGEPIPAVPLAELRPDLPAAVSDVVGQALQRDPARRFATVESFANALAEALAATQVSGTASLWQRLTRRFTGALNKGNS